MPKLELIYDPDCPNVEPAREQLRRACAEAGVPAQWQEWDRSAAESPAYVQPYGSPTILVDGADVVPGAAMDGQASCRVYRDADGGIVPAPSTEVIVHALRESLATVTADTGAGGWSRLGAALPGVGIALVPACPACWPAYAGVLSAAGFGPLLNTRFQFPLTTALLAVVLGTLAYRAPRRRGYGPLGLGAAACAVVLVGKFVLVSNPLTYVGAALVMGATVWNAWPRPTAAGADCAACVEDAPGAEAPA